MRTRQSRAEAMQGMATATTPIGDLEDLFERWELDASVVQAA